MQQNLGMLQNQLFPYIPHEGHIVHLLTLMDACCICLSVTLLVLPPKTADVVSVCPIVFQIEQSVSAVTSD